MTGFRKAAAFVGLFALVILAAAPALAGVLGTGLSYNDGDRVWEGNTPFVGDFDPTLNGSVDWAVFEPGKFPFTGGGYSPTPGEFTYVYQLHCTGSAAVSFYGVGLVNDADNPGYLVDAVHGVTGVAPSSYIMSAGEVDWLFGDDVTHSGGIEYGDASCGLVFSSPKTPMDYLGVAINHGDGAVTEPVPSPSANSIPEPATIWLFGIGLFATVGACRLRRR